MERKKRKKVMFPNMTKRKKIRKKNMENVKECGYDYFTSFPNYMSLCVLLIF